MLENGDLEKGTLTAGQSMGLFQDIPACKELLDRIISYAMRIIQEKISR